jgi:MFS family permease
VSFIDPHDSVTFTWAGGNVGTVVTMLLSPLVMQHWHWPSLFYISGGLGLIWSFAWLVLIDRDPVTQLKRYERVSRECGANYSSERVVCHSPFMNCTSFRRTCHLPRTDLSLPGAPFSVVSLSMRCYLHTLPVREAIFSSLTQH